MSETHLRSLAITVREIETKYPRYSLAAFTHKNNNGVGLTFENKRWLVTLYQDHSAHIVIRKASQVGITEFALVDMFWLAAQGISGMYILPTDTWRSTFVPNRVDQVMDYVPLYKRSKLKRFHSSDAVGMKTICGHNWKFVGSQVRGNFYEFPAGAFIVDEFDLCDKDNLTFAQDRLGADLMGGRTRKFGNPSVSGSGIDGEYELSDQKEWHVSCHCGHKQVLNWFTHFIDEGDPPELQDPDGNPVCEKCHEPFDRLGPGEWIAENPGEEISGYSISKLFADSRPIPVVKKLYDNYLKSLHDPTALQRFWNNDLGLPFDAEGFKVTDSLLSACVEPGYRFPEEAKGTYGGIDVGKPLYVHISKVEANGVRRKVFIGTTKDFEEADFIVKKYGATRGIIDALPETHESEKFVKSHPGWLMAYYGPVKGGRPKVDWRKKTITVERTPALDASYQWYCEKKVVLPANWRSIHRNQFVKQMIAPTRVFDQDANKGVGGFVWSDGKADHHRHADTYDHFACLIAQFAVSGTTFVGEWS